jgi:RNA polymerase sigma factor (sigma-70 family)
MTVNESVARTAAEQVDELYRVHAVGLIRAALLRTRRRAALSGVQHDPPVWSAESAMLAGQDQRDVLAAVARLPRRQRQILVLRFYLDLPEDEIAATLRVSRSTVASTTSRALVRLARDLKEAQ